MDQQRKILLKIFEIVDTEEDKEAFVDFFTDLLFEETVYTLIQSLPEAKREKVAKQWDANISNHAALTSILNHNFTKQQLTEASEKAAEKAIQDYLSSNESKLNDDQKRKLQKLSEEFTAVS